MTCFLQTSWQPVTFPNTGHMDIKAVIKNTNFVINYNKYKCNQLCCGLFCLPATENVQQQKVTIKFSLNVSYSKAATCTFGQNHECESGWICRANEPDAIRARAELLESPYSPYLDVQ